MSATQLIKTLNAAISAARTPIYSSTKVALVDAEFEPKTTETTEIVFNNTTELVPGTPDLPTNRDSPLTRYKRF